MKAIMSRYYGQTNTRPAKYVATDSDDNVGQSNESHLGAVRDLCSNMNLQGTLVQGGWKNGTQVFVWKDGSQTYEV